MNIAFFINQKKNIASLKFKGKTTYNEHPKKKKEKEKRCPFGLDSSIAHYKLLGGVCACSFMHT